MKPGKYDNISLEEYHKLPAWSKSSLDHIAKSPAHYTEWKNNPKEPTPAMAFGSAFHCSVLTPVLYENQYAIYPECDRRTNISKAIYAEFIANNQGKLIISAIDAGIIERMKNEVMQHPLASQLLTSGEAEQSFFWIDPKTGLECKARPDYLRNDDICIDLKVSNSAEYHAFQKTAYKFRYHVQGAFFIDGIFQSTERQCSEFVLIVIEDEPPFGIMVYVFDDLAIDTGRITYKNNLETVIDWKEHPELYRTVYPVSENPVELSLPTWAE